MSITTAVLLAIPGGLAASALHARAYRRREARLELLAAAVAKFPAGAYVVDLAEELGLTPYQRGTVYADLALLEARGLVTHCWDHERGRMSWTATTPTTTTGA